MGRKRAVKVEDKTGVSSKFDALVGSNEFRLGDEKFIAKPFKERDDDLVYDDSVKFLAKGLPITFKVLGLLNTIQNYGVLDDDFEIGSKTSDLINELDIPSVLAKLGSELPELVAIVCHATDPSINAGDVKRLVKTFTDFEMIRAILIQTKLEGFGESLAKLKVDAESITA